MNSKSLMIASVVGIVLIVLMMLGMGWYGQAALAQSDDGPDGPGGPPLPGGPPRPPRALARPGGPMGPAMLRGMMGGAAICATEKYVYVVRWNTIYQFGAEDLRLVNKVTLEEEMPPWRSRPRE
ncbi:MAG TPA: hypothetical protein EYP85_07110 [Armatimonadetes bacterium]|nr:hypothetical protein [Armatimonadota bacterium]